MNGTVAELVRLARIRRGWTQTELALETGLRQAYISQVEKGEIAIPRDPQLEKLGAALGLTLSDFYRAAGRLEGMNQSEPPGLYPDDLESADLRAIFANPNAAATLRQIRLQEGDEAYRQALGIIADQLGVTLRAIERGRAR